MTGVPRPSLSYRTEDGLRLGALLWRFGPGWRMISSAMLGGGIGPREWVLNAQVAAGYSRMDPVEHMEALGPGGPGVGMMTAALVERYAVAADGGAEAVATVGLGVPTWAAAPEGVADPGLPAAPESGREHAGVCETGGRVPRPGTINILVAVPVAFSDPALVNAVMTVTEAKTQALLEAGFPCTGTASDAVCVAVREDGPAEAFGGPRSVWGARIARAVHRAVLDGAGDWRTRRAGTTARFRDL
ncbi:adenosylcobinamide amidohydrolase [Microbispora bryophytorum]|uniref:Adenosylcobinamide amidohydrolase n=1 Tax=Microbispora bryophytorum TaxID=1460882 RepID=A0A8H9GYP6_9ACTN|nr:adenosylcobinamide amidohydrolase [Microbispora bryophytorum]MBD3135064.1 adenosylcobinamide amidohydrolase [Microbispora bryophytorum]TQS08705.1 adenosylcobinamide amidohydrolase [Microbispora bryophytorum]GGO10839.1 adenosylcobinamide amidohydrolase [Microbispora bryophytorum]